MLGWVLGLGWVCGGVCVVCMMCVVCMVCVQYGECVGGCSVVGVVWCVLCRCVYVVSREKMSNM